VRGGFIHPCLVAGSHAASQPFFTPQLENLRDGCEINQLVIPRSHEAEANVIQVDIL
jgi:hypothetical protein